MGNPIFLAFKSWNI